MKNKALGKGITVTFTFSEDWKRDYDGIIPELILEDAIRELADGVGYEIITEPCEGKSASDTEGGLHLACVNQKRELLYGFITWYNAKPKVQKGEHVYTTDVDEFLKP